MSDRLVVQPAVTVGSGRLSPGPGATTACAAQRLKPLLGAVGEQRWALLPQLLFHLVQGAGCC